MTTALARDYKVDVSSDAAAWLSLKGINDLADAENPTLQPTDDFDTDGFNSFEKTMTGGKLTAKVFRKKNAGAFDPAQELCRARRFKFDEAARIYVRWYDKNGGDEAHQMYALVDWNASKTAVTDVAEVTITFTADGVVSDIDNPIAGTTVPVITGATPPNAATGDEVEITGQGFTGATSVKFGAVSATEYVVVSDTVIVAVMPTGSAGAAAVTVVTPGGTSNALDYTRDA